MKNRIIPIAALSVAALLVSAGAASAYTIDPSGKGFVGKGEVQSALGFNNAALQKAVDAKSLVFTATQATSTALTQALSQAGTQVGSQAGTQAGTQAGSQVATQAVGQDLTCTFTNGSGTKVFHRDGERDGSRDGSRTGTRTGSREGSRNGSRDGVRTRGHQHRQRRPGP